MAIPTIEKREEYGRLRRTLREVGETNNDRESRSILREMAAEWLRLVDAADQ
jgi:hypothetical protein